MASVKERKLDPRFLPFIDAYIEALFSGEKKPEKSACLALGIAYSGQLRKDGVRDEISKRVNDYLSLADIDKVRVLLETKKLAFSSLADVVEFDGTTVKAKSFARIAQDAPEALDAIQSIKMNGLGEVEVKMYNKNDALKDLQSIFNMKTATVNVNHGLQKPGLFDFFDPNEDDETPESQMESFETVMQETLEASLPEIEQS